MSKKPEFSAVEVILGGLVFAGAFAVGLLVRLRWFWLACAVVWIAVSYIPALAGSMEQQKIAITIEQPPAHWAYTIIAPIVVAVVGGVILQLILRRKKS
jgi:hypothetical protein